MSTSLRSLFACLALATLGHFACSDTPDGSSRTSTVGSGTNSSGATGDATSSTSGTSSNAATSGSTGDVTTSGVTSGPTSGAGGAASTSVATGSAGSSVVTGAGGATTGAGGAGTGGSGGSGGAAVACGSNGQPYTGPLLGRCSPMSCTDRNCGTAVGKGGFLTLDDFEITGQTAAVTGAGVVNMTWPSRDKRNGSWHQYSDPLAMAAMQLAPSGGGGSADSTQAIHYTGMKGAYGATLALPLGGAMASNEAGCYDASAYDGISFWIKGNPGAGNTQVKFNVQSPVSEPAMTGGACLTGCYDHFSAMVPITATWTRVKVPWADLKRQSCAVSSPATPPNFQPQKQILAVSFQQVDPMKAFDFWIDDIVLSVDTRPTTDFGSTVTQAMFSEMFPALATPYTYQGFVDAVKAHGAGLAGNPNQIDNKREAAAFLAQIAHETGSLTTAREKCQATCSMGLAMNCTGMEPTRPCTSGNTYYGRGAIQLTTLANYTSAQGAGFPGIVANPDLVATNVDFAFGTAVWFWMTTQSAVGICHTAIVGGNFGQTTRIINGMECGGTLQDSRVLLYRQMCAALGINPGGTLRC